MLTLYGNFRATEYARIKSHKCAFPHGQVVFISVKLAIYDTFVQLKKFGESDFQETNLTEKWTIM